jgi:hypothetical protein
MTSIENPRPGIAARALIAPIIFYRRFLSSLFPPTCRYAPSCSHYAMDAIAVHGAPRGAVLALRRILRCHPITWLGGSSGFDPVPPPRHRSL